jgi:hypothetical protein
MSVLLAAALFVLSAALLYFHLRWAMIDPHNPAAQPGPGSTVIRSILITIGFGLATALPSHIGGALAAAFGSFCLGLVVGPAINPPSEPRVDEEPSWVARKLESVRVALGGGALKALVLGMLTWIIGYTGLQYSWYFVLVAIALLLNFSKTGVVATMVEHPPIAASLHRARIRLDKPTIYRLSLMGNLSLAVWFVLWFPLLDTIAHPTMQDWLAILALIIGLIVAALA